MRRLLIITVELIIVAAAIQLANLLQQHISFIPKSIIQLPDVDYSPSDFKTIFTYFLIIHAIVFMLGQWLTVPWKAASAERTANELFALAVGFAASTLAVFVTTSVNFDPNLMVAIAACNAALFILTHFAVSLFSGHSVIQLLTELIRFIFKRLFSVAGILILVFAITPAILAKAFVSNRDVANVITQVRIFFSSQGEYQYSLISAVGQHRFTQPMQVKTPPGEDQLLYILERGGKIYRLDMSASTEPELILDISDKTGFIEMENGALGFDFHPKFSLDPKNPQQIYLYYTDVRDNKQTNRLSSFNLNSDDLQTRSDSEQSLFALERETSGFHNGGSVEFGPDGFLYIALGEGVRTPQHGSFANSLRMGILRIDIDKQGGRISKPVSRRPKNGITANYYIPLDNPFLDRADILEEYWALGLRNPFRINFDPKTGQLWAGDVGSTKWEEVNLIQGGGHYQFPFIEGYEETGKDKPSPLLGTEIPPVYTYFHTASERAVIGGIVYHGDEFPEFEGKYLFADNYASILYLMPTDQNRVKSVTNIARAGQFAQRGISSVSQLSNGTVITTTLGRSSQPTGEVLKLVRGKVDTSLASKPEETALTTTEIRDIFDTNCSRCHGSGGRADGPDTALLGVTVADFTTADFQQSRSNEALRKIIAEGGPPNGLNPLMPPWQGILTEGETRGLVEYIRSFADED